MQSKRPAPTPVIDVAPSTAGYTYQTDRGSHERIQSGTELTYVGDEMYEMDEVYRLEVGRTYTFVRKDTDCVILRDAESAVEKRVTREAFAHMVRNRYFSID